MKRFKLDARTDAIYPLKEKYFHRLSKRFSSDPMGEQGEY
jgi:hypothetical protein